MNRAIVLAALAAGCAAPHEGHWTYEGTAGPSHWGELSASYRACAAGRAQSPIDLDLAHADHEALPPLVVRYHASACTEIDNGHTIEDRVAPGDAIELGGTRYELEQFHVHHPSEHLLAGRRFPLEVHLVHRSARGALLVVSVLVEEGAANAAIGELLDHLPHHHERQHLVVDPATLLPPDRHYATYAGSLTTPPCTEGVTWVVMRTPVEASPAQLDRVARAVRHNNRPVVPLGDRHVRTDLTP